MTDRVEVTRTGVQYSVQGDGPPLVLISGFGQSTDVWDSVLHRFAHRFRTHVFANRGSRGQGVGTTALTIDRMVDDAASVIESIGEPAAVLGWSMGGAVAQRLAHRRPELVRAMVLLSSMARRTELQRNWTNGRLSLLASDASAVEIETLLLPWVFTPAFLSEPRRGLSAAHANAGRGTDLAGLQAQAEALAGFDSRSWLHQIHVPTLVVVGAEDVLTPVSSSVELASGIQGADLVVLPRGGHAVILESPGEVIPPILRFLHDTVAEKAAMTHEFPRGEMEIPTCT